MKKYFEDGLSALTPVENRVGRLYKREDKFAPLGYGNVNGSKLRQLVWLVRGYRGVGGIITGASVLSPQVPMTAAVGAAYGLPVIIVLGGTNLRSALKHPNVKMAYDLGAEFRFAPVGYNPALQRKVKEVQLSEASSFYRLPYGITTEEGASDERIESFHAVGAKQVSNLPEDMRDLILPFGSGNSAVSVLYGLAQRPPASLTRITLVGIGPTRLRWLKERLSAIERATDKRILELFRPNFVHHPDLEAEFATSNPRYVLRHLDLHTTRFAKYADKMNCTEDGITFHPTYEGKVMRYLDLHPHLITDWEGRGGHSLLWVVGSEPGVRS